MRRGSGLVAGALLRSAGRVCTEAAPAADGAPLPLAQLHLQRVLAAAGAHEGTSCLQLSAAPYHTSSSCSGQREGSSLTLRKPAAAAAAARRSRSSDDGGSGRAPPRVGSKPSSSRSSGSASSKRRLFEPDHRAPTCSSSSSSDEEEWISSGRAKQDQQVRSG